MKKIKFSTIQKVQKLIPKAKLFKTNNNTYYIGYINDVGDVVNILNEYLLPSQHTEEDAWNQTLLCLKTTQHFNRTHPLKVDMYSKLEKQERVSNRKNKAKLNKEKFSDGHIYY